MYRFLFVTFCSILLIPAVEADDYDSGMPFFVVICILFIGVAILLIWVKLCCRYIRSREEQQQGVVVIQPAPPFQYGQQDHSAGYNYGATQYPSAPSYQTPGFSYYPPTGTATGSSNSTNPHFQSAPSAVAKPGYSAEPPPTYNNLFPHQPTSKE